jgi:DNA invertase Pin-like site-specific DNA recombinase
MGSSLEMQDEALHAKATRNGWVVMRLFSDEGVSGRGITDRVAMQEALDYAEMNLSEGDIFAVYNISRLARNTRDGLNVLERLRSKGIVLADIDREYYDNPVDNLILNTYLNIAQFQSDENKFRTRIGMRRMRLEGRFLGGAPFGYRCSGNKHLSSLIIQVEEAEVVVGIFERAVRGRSQTDIAMWLEENGVFASRSKANSLESNKKTVKRWLTSRTYVGFMTNPDTKDEIRGDWEPIISEELWTLANRALNFGSNVSHTSHKTRSDEYPLKKVLICPNRGDKFTAYKAKKRFGYYQCKGRGCKKRALIPVEVAHAQFEELLKSVTETQGMIEQSISLVESEAKAEVHESQSAVRGLEQRLKGLSDKRSKYLDALVEDKITKADFEHKDEKLREDIALINERLNCIPKMDALFVEEAVLELRNLLLDPLEFWRDTPSEIKPELALAFFPNRIICENRTLRTSDFLGLTKVPAPFFHATGQEAPPTGFELADRMLHYLNGKVSR